jgi:hypothetical protein
MSLQTLLRSVMEFVGRSYEKIWTCAALPLHQDNAAAHVSLKTTECVINNMVIVPHPPYSPDLAPCDFGLFPEVKLKLKLRCLETVSDIQRESQAVLESIKGKWLPRCFWSMKKKWWDRCIRPQGDYFEGDGSQNWVSLVSISFLS